MKLACTNQPSTCHRTNNNNNYNIANFGAVCFSSNFSSKMTFDDVTMTSDGETECNTGENAECVTCHSITVCKTNSNDRIGLTLLYRQTDCDDITSDVIVDHIDRNSAIAECDIQRGDIIVEINGMPVRSRDHVMRTLSTAAGGSCITVMLARRDVTRQIIDVEDDDELDAGFDDCISNFTTDRHISSAPQLMNMYNVATGRMLECIDEEDDLTDHGGECTSQHPSEEIDSGLSKTDESIRNDESSEQDTDSPTGYSPHSRFRGENNSSIPRRPSALSINSNDGNFVLLPSRPSTSIPYRQHARQASPPSISPYCEIDRLSGGKPPLPPRCRPVPRTTKHHQAIVDHVTLLNGINRLMITEDLVTKTKTTTQRRVPRMGTRLHPNTATSTGLHVNLTESSNIDYFGRKDQSWSPDHDYCVITETSRCSESPVLTSRTPISGSDTRLSPLQFLDLNRVCSPPPLPSLPCLPSTPRTGSASPTTDYSIDVDDASHSPTCVVTSRGTQTLAASEAYQQCADVMYTNHANLEHTIAVQQRLFRQQLADRHRRQSTSPTTITPMPPPRRARDSRDETFPSVTSSHQRIEWVVRRRSDGSRYVTRRPAGTSATRSTPAADSPRHRQTSAKTTAVCNGRLFAEAWTTTDDDDDDGESPKAGRYWTREQRRQHVADRRRREALKQQAREANDVAAELVSPSDNRVRRGMNRVRRALVSDMAVGMAVVDGPPSGHAHTGGLDANGGRRLFNSSGQLLSVATV